MANPDINELNKQIADLRDQLGYFKLKIDFTDISLAKKELEGYKKILYETDDEFKNINQSLSTLLKYLTRGKSEINEITSAARKTYSISKDLMEHRRGEVELSKKELQSISEKLNAYEKLTEQVRKLNPDPNSAAKMNAGGLKNNLAKVKSLFIDVSEIQERVNKNAGVKLFTGIEDLTNSIPGLRVFSSSFREAAQSAKDIAHKGSSDAQILKTGRGLTKEKIAEMGFSSQLRGLSGKAAANKANMLGLKAPGSGIIEPLMAGFKALGPIIKSALGPIFWITLLIEGLAKADKETTELKKSMALTTWESEKFRTNLALAAATSGNINITTSKLLETFSSINKQFGFISNFSADTLVTTTKLTQVVGVAGESANNLAAASELNGLNFETAYKNSIGTSYELQRQAGVQFDLRDILTESGKVTGQIRANLGANPSVIAAAVTQSKLFGASLQEVNAAGKAFLDFESSIENELQAELLLGKDINLEGARRAALNGDQAALARELTAQAGSFSEYSKMNVLQQQSLAQALGMSSDQLSDILFKQGVQGRNVKELQALGEDELAQRLESQTLADKFSATMDKLKGIFTDVATAFMPVLVVLGAALGIVGAIVGLVRDLIVGIGSLFGWTKFGESGFLNGLKGTAGLLGIPTGDIISPANGITQISTKEGGLFNLSPNDDVIAAPGIASRVNQYSNDNVIAAPGIASRVNQSSGTNMSETNMLLRQILTKQGTVQIDNTKIGTAFAMNTYEIQ